MRQIPIHPEHKFNLIFAHPVETQKSKSISFLFFLIRFSNLNSNSIYDTSNFQDIFIQK